METMDSTNIAKGKLLLWNHCCHRNRFVMIIQQWSSCSYGNTCHCGNDAGYQEDLDTVLTFFAFEMLLPRKSV